MNFGIARRRKEGINFFLNDRNKHGMSAQGSSTGEEVTELETSTVDVKFYSLSTIIDATENFSITNKVGEGGFGSVYKVLCSLTVKLHPIDST